MKRIISIFAIILMSLTSMVYLQSCQKEKGELVVNKNESEMVVNKAIGGSLNPSHVFGFSQIGIQHNEYMDYYISRPNIPSKITPSGELQTMRTYLINEGQDPSDMTVTQSDVSQLMQNINNETMSISPYFVIDPNTRWDQFDVQLAIKEYYTKLDVLINSEDVYNQFNSGNINGYLSSILNTADEIKNHPTIDDINKAKLMYCYEIAYYSGSYWNESVHNDSNPWHSSVAYMYQSMTNQSIDNITIAGLSQSKREMRPFWRKFFAILIADIQGALVGCSGGIPGALIGAAVYSGAAAIEVCN